MSACAATPPPDWMTSLRTCPEDEALYLLFERFDDMFLAGRFDEADKLCAAVDLSGLSAAVAFGFVAITAAASDKLPGRPQLLARVRAYIANKEGEDYAAALWSTFR